MDILVGGAKHILRNFNVSSNKILHYNLNNIQSNLNLNEEQWLNLCVLSGCDYCSRIQGVGVKNAYKFIQKYTLDEIFKILAYKAPLDYVGKFKRAKELFLKLIDTDEINNLEIKKQKINGDIINFLKEYTNLTEKQINNRLTIINSSIFNN